jgi:membrane protease YdiL (CAAX protease family)
MVEVPRVSDSDSVPLSNAGSGPATAGQALDPFDVGKVWVLGSVLSFIATVATNGNASTDIGTVVRLVLAAILVYRKRVALTGAFRLKAAPAVSVAFPVPLAMVGVSLEMLAVSLLDSITGGAFGRWAVSFTPDRLPDSLWGAILLIGVVVPVTEELFFRGFFLSAFEGWGAGWAVVFPSALFAFFHAPTAIPGAFLLAATSAILAMRSGSILPSLALHMAWNLYAMVAAILEYYGAWAFYLTLCGSVLLIFRFRSEYGRLWSAFRDAWRGLRDEPGVLSRLRSLWGHWSYKVISVLVAGTLAALIWMTLTGGGGQV